MIFPDVMSSSRREADRYTTRVTFTGAALFLWGAYLGAACQGAKAPRSYSSSALSPYNNFDM